MFFSLWFIFIPFIFFEINSISKHIKAKENLIAASEKDLFLYRQMGASYLCIASKAEVDFNKGLGIAMKIGSENQSLPFF